MDNRVWVKDAVMTIRLPEEVDHFVADRLREEAGEILVERNVREVVFDFRKTVFMDSSGIGLVMGRFREMELIGGKVRAVHVGERCRVESVDAVIQYCIAICRYRDTNSVIGIISGMFFTFVNEWNTVCKIPRPKFSVQFGVDFLYICCSFIIGKTCQKCCIPFVGVSLPVIFKNFFTEAGSRYGISCPHCRHTSHKWNGIGSIIISLYEGRYTVCRFYHILFICFSP